jgi:hypothetical protein
MMAGGRFLGDGLIGKFGRKPSLQTSGIMISAGLLQPYSSPVCHSRNHRIYCWFGSFHHSSCIQFTVWPENPKCIAQRSLNHTVSSVCLWFSWVRQSSGHRELSFLQIFIRIYYVFGIHRQWCPWIKAIWITINFLEHNISRFHKITKTCCSQYPMPKSMDTCCHRGSNSFELSKNFPRKGMQ